MNTEREIRDLLKELFSCTDSEISHETGPGDIPQWDSLGHIQLLEAISDRFAKDIPIEQAIEARTVGELIRLIDSASSA